MTDISFLITDKVDISVIDSAFTEEFLAEFRRSHHDFRSVKDHVVHLAWLVSTRQIHIPIRPDQFIDGYGEIGRFLKSARTEEFESEEWS